MDACGAVTFGSPDTDSSLPQGGEATVTQRAPADARPLTYARSGSASAEWVPSTTRGSPQHHHIPARARTSTGSRLDKACVPLNVALFMIALELRGDRSRRDTASLRSASSASAKLSVGNACTGRSDMAKKRGTRSSNPRNAKPQNPSSAVGPQGDDMLNKSMVAVGAIAAVAGVVVAVWFGVAQMRSSQLTEVRTVTPVAASATEEGGSGGTKEVLDCATGSGSSERPGARICAGEVLVWDPCFQIDESAVDCPSFHRDGSLIHNVFAFREREDFWLENESNSGSDADPLTGPPWALQVEGEINGVRNHCFRRDFAGLKNLGDVTYYCQPSSVAGMQNREGFITGTNRTVMAADHAGVDSVGTAAGPVAFGLARHEDRRWEVQYRTPGSSESSTRTVIAVWY